MATIRELGVVQKFIRADLAASMLVNRICHRAWIRHFFSTVSRLGDGIFWYVTMAILPFIYGLDGLGTTIQMLVTGIVALVIYKFIKQGTERPRPCAVSPQILRGTAPLDEYSFPSGHTLHAVAFTLTACASHPELALILAPFTACVAMSRVILGLHYLTDVVAGAALGALLAHALLPIGSSLRLAYPF